MTKSVADLEKAIKKVSSELDAIEGRTDVEMIQAFPILSSLAQRLSGSWTPFQERLQALPAKYEPEWLSAVDSFSVRLANALAAIGWVVSGDPTRPVVEGIVFVSVDSAKPDVKVNGKSVKDLSIDSIVSTVGECVERIQRELTPLGPFLAAIEKAYLDELGTLGLQPGTQVHVSAVYQRLLLARQPKAFFRDSRIEYFKEYPIDVFRADLFQALKDHRTAPSGAKLRVSSGSDTDGAIFMLVPSLGRTGYVGRIWLER